MKTAFVKDSQQYIQFLINEVLNRTGLTSSIVKGLAAFDPFIMFKRPMEVALKHFDMLYSTFALRFWVPNANESLCLDQYMQLLDHLRTSLGSNFDLTSTSSNLIEFLVGLEFLQDRAHLFHPFKLCCLCASAVTPAFPDVTFGAVTTAGRQNRFTDVILSCQSYLANLRDSVAFVAMRTSWLIFLSFLPLLGVPLFPVIMILGHMSTPLGAPRSISPCWLPAVLCCLLQRRLLFRLMREMPFPSLMIQL